MDIYTSRSLVILWCLILWSIGYFWWSIFHVSDSIDATTESVFTWSIPSFDSNDEKILDGYGKWGEDVSPVAEEVDSIEQEIDVDVFADAYTQAKRMDDVSRQWTVLEQLYTKKQDYRLLPYLVETAVYMRRYDDALRYVSILEDKNLLHTLLDHSTVFSLLFNWLELTFKDINRIKQIMLYYSETWFMTQADEHLYSSLITYVRGDMENYAYFMKQLEWSSLYVDRPKQYAENIWLAASFKDVPESYVDALTALHIFSQWYYQVSRKAALRSIDISPQYILPHQIAAYSSFFLGDWSQVHGYVEWLKKNDVDHYQLYTFLQAITYFEQQQYPQALLLFQEIDHTDFLQDARRYLLLSYARIGDMDGVHDVLQQLMQYDDMSPYDYFTLFDLFFYEPLRKDEDVILFAMYFATAYELIDACYVNMSDEYAYICLYGKSGLLLANGEDDKAYQYLSRLTRRYPKAFIYETLGDISARDKRYDDARSWFMQALSIWVDEFDKEQIVHKVRSVILQEK